MARRISDLMCQVHSVSYDFDKRAGTLILAADNCCDMSGCIRYFCGIDANVELIETFAAGVPDIIYMKDVDGWSAFTPSSPSSPHRIAHRSR